MPPGANNTGILPTGAMPPGANNTGILPTGAMPTGAMPTGAMPTGAIPPGANNTGVRPTSTMTNSNYPLEIPSINVNPKTNNMQTSSETKSVDTSDKENKPNMGNNPSGVYVDLDCFMKNINVLQNHTDNMMIDLSLLLSNIKTCSYIKKTSSNSKGSGKMDTNQLINEVTSKINIPEPDVIKLKNIKADVLVTDNGSNSQLVEVTKEPFSSDSEEKSNNWIFKDFMLVIILIILLFLLIFRK
jgi:hypothetical protein